MVFECTCGEWYTVDDEAAPESFRCSRCGSVFVRETRSRLWPRLKWSWFPENAGTLLYAGVAVLCIAALAGILKTTVADAGDSYGHPGVVMRAETAPSKNADGALGRGVLKVINESGKAVALRLIGPEHSYSRTIFVPAWDDGRVFGLAPGTWTARYCTGSEWRPDTRRFAVTTACAELDETIQYTETISGETLQYGAAVVRFGPAPDETPPAHAIPSEDFIAD